MKDGILQELLDRQENLARRLHQSDALNNARFGKIRELLNHQAIIETVLRLGVALDEQDWVGVASCLATEIETDYSSFRGAPPTRLSNNEFVALRQAALSGLRTQHLSLNHLVSVDPSGATCRTDCVIHRWPTDPTDPRFFHSYGYYHYGLIHVESTWLIHAITQVVLRSDGDPMLHGALRASDP
ncbi:MAG: nuclear transport factor 2 family protein [Ardenticatenales bacterium]|nr:nuclear transport factor 2 family protein [Ardenticatenales bacterium]